MADETCNTFSCYGFVVNTNYIDPCNSFDSCNLAIMLRADGPKQEHREPIADVPRRVRTATPTPFAACCSFQGIDPTDGESLLKSQPSTIVATLDFSVSHAAWYVRAPVPPRWLVCIIRDIATHCQMCTTRGALFENPCDAISCLAWASCATCLQFETEQKIRKKTFTKITRALATVPDNPESELSASETIAASTVVVSDFTSVDAEVLNIIGPQMVWAFNVRYHGIVVDNQYACMAVALWLANVDRIRGCYPRTEALGMFPFAVEPEVLTRSFMESKHLLEECALIDSNTVSTDPSGKHPCPSGPFSTAAAVSMALDPSAFMEVYTGRLSRDATYAPNNEYDYRGPLPTFVIALRLTARYDDKVVMPALPLLAIAIVSEIGWANMLTAFDMNETLIRTFCTTDDQVDKAKHAIVRCMANWFFAISPVFVICERCLGSSISTNAFEILESEKTIATTMRSAPHLTVSASMDAPVFVKMSDPSIFDPGVSRIPSVAFSSAINAIACSRDGGCHGDVALRPRMLEQVFPLKTSGLFDYSQSTGNVRVERSTRSMYDVFSLHTPAFLLVDTDMWTKEILIAPESERRHVVAMSHNVLPRISSVATQLLYGMVASINDYPDTLNMLYSKKQTDRICVTKYRKCCDNCPIVLVQMYAMNDMEPLSRSALFGKLKYGHKSDNVLCGYMTPCASHVCELAMVNTTPIKYNAIMNDCDCANIAIATEEICRLKHACPRVGIWDAPTVALALGLDQDAIYTIARCKPLSISQHVYELVTTTLTNPEPILEEILGGCIEGLSSASNLSLNLSEKLKRSNSHIGATLPVLEEDVGRTIVPTGPLTFVSLIIGESRVAWSKKIYKLAINLLGHCLYYYDVTKYENIRRTYAKDTTDELSPPSSHLVETNCEHCVMLLFNTIATSLVDKYISNMSTASSFSALYSMFTPGDSLLATLQDALRTKMQPIIECLHSVKVQRQPSESNVLVCSRCNNHSPMIDPMITLGWKTSALASFITVFDNHIKTSQS